MTETEIANELDIIKESLKNQKVVVALNGKTIQKIIYVPNKVINFVTKGVT